MTGQPRYRDLISAWLQAVTLRLDPETGLLPHIGNGADGTDTTVARATSQVIMLRLLPDIDANFAKDQFLIFRERFFTSFLGLPCVQEYPTGITGQGDVDSGPLIFGRSISGTVMMMGVAQVYGDHDFANAIVKTGEVVGLPWTSDEKKPRSPVYFRLAISS
jgi:hypothetical protein